MQCKFSTLHLHLHRVVSVFVEAAEWNVETHAHLCICASMHHCAQTLSAYLNKAVGICVDASSYSVAVSWRCCYRWSFIGWKQTNFPAVKR